MSFLESIQHGLEKASQEASRITKIQHLHGVGNDLSFKATQEGQTLINKAMEMYYQGILAQGELTAICQQIATYQQQLNEVHEELERLQNKADENEQIPLPPQPAPQAYAPGTVPPYPAPQAGYPYPMPGYPAPAPQAGYPYPAQAGYPPYPTAPLSPSGEPPTRPGTQTQEDQPPTQPLPSSSEPPTSPAQAAVQAAPAQDEAHASHKPRQHHKAAPAQDEVSTAGTYANGTLPPIYSPFTANPTGAPAADAEPAAEPEKPAKAHHRTKKAAEDASAEPAH